MSEEKPDYKTEVEEALSMLGVGYDKNEPAVVIEKPRKDLALYDGSLADYKVWGWVKKSAKFIFHVRRLRGAKLSIWEIVALSIDENGESALSLKDLVTLTGYSRSEVSESLKELEEMGYLTVQKETGKKSIFKPSFAARGESLPSEEPVQFLDGSTRPVSTHRYPSSSPEEKIVPSSRELKELIKQADQTVDGFLHFEKLAKQAENLGSAWNGRELTPENYIPYGDWFHSKTGLQMYSSKGKQKVDATWLKEFKEWWENEIDLTSLQSAYEVENGWRKVKSGIEQNITHPRELTAKAKTIAAAGIVTQTPEVTYDQDGAPESW